MGHLRCKRHLRCGIHYNDDHTAAHPNVHKTALRRIQSETYIDISSIDCPLSYAPDSTPRTESHDDVREAREYLASGERSLLPYLRLCGRLNYDLRKKSEKKKGKE